MSGPQYARVGGNEEVAKVDKSNTLIDSVLEKQSKFSIRTRTTSSWTKSPGSEIYRLATSHLAAPWEHGVPREGPPTCTTVRELHYGRQTRRLLTNSAFQCFVTLFLCGALAACLAGFQSLAFLTLQQKHAFNALVIGLSLCLGFNLAGSLSGYAGLMRWRFLASHYRPLDEFELLLSCQDQMNVLRLFWIARTKGYFWFNKTQLVCLTYLLVQLSLQLLVALLGLTYSLDTSSWVDTSLGNLSICDLSIIRDLYNDTVPNYYAQLASANAYGIQGQDYAVVDLPWDQQIDQQTIYTNASQTYYEYRFIDQNPNAQTEESSPVTIVSDRTINASCTCQQYPLLSGGFGNTSYFSYFDSNHQNITINTNLVSPGAMTYMSNANSSCGSRCTTVRALQSGWLYPNGTVYVPPSFFICNATLSPVNNIAEYLQQNTSLPSIFNIPDTQARILSGAIGWSGFYFTNDTWEYVRYSLDSWWSPSLAVTSDTVASLIAQFATDAIAAMDNNGPRVNVTNQMTPFTVQLVNVEWRWAATLLAVIPTIQGIVLVTVVSWAGSGVVIKDASCLSMARLLRPVVDRLGKRGCLLTGVEIANELREERVVYGAREPRSDGTAGGDVVRHVDVIFQGEGQDYTPGMMPEGRYDGEPTPENHAERSGEIRQRRKKRRISI